MEDKTLKLLEIIFAQNSAYGDTLHERVESLGRVTTHFRGVISAGQSYLRPGRDYPLRQYASSSLPDAPGLWLMFYPASEGATLANVFNVGNDLCIMHDGKPTKLVDLDVEMFWLRVE